MSEPRWVDKRALVLLHGESLAEHGGSAGMRDEGLLDSALAKPRNRHAYESESDLSRLAASYGIGIAKNHPFVDGNKRSGAFTFIWFLRKSGVRGAKNINPSGLTAITLLIAESNPAHKDKVVALVVELLKTKGV